MGTSLTVKNIPEGTIERLKERAKANHRSLQGEIRALLEEAAGLRALTVEEVYRRVRSRGVATSSSVELIREMRDARHGS